MNKINMKTCLVIMLLCSTFLFSPAFADCPDGAVDCKNLNPDLTKDEPVSKRLSKKAGRCSSWDSKRLMGICSWCTNGYENAEKMCEEEFGIKYKTPVLVTESLFRGE